MRGAAAAECKTAMGLWRCGLHLRYRIEPTPWSRATGPAPSASGESGDCASTRAVGGTLYPARGEQGGFDSGLGALGAHQCHQYARRLGLLTPRLNHQPTLLALVVIDRHCPALRPASGPVAAKTRAHRHAGGLRRSSPPAAGRLTAPFLTAAAGRALPLEAAAAPGASAPVLIAAPDEDSGPAAQQSVHLATAFWAERDG